MLPSITTIKILKSTEERRRFAQRGGVRGIVSSASSCGFALILLTQLERKERRENNARLIKRLKVFFAIELNISALLCTLYGSRLMLVLLTRTWHACTYGLTRGWRWKHPPIVQFACVWEASTLYTAGQVQIPKFIVIALFSHDLYLFLSASTTPTALWHWRKHCVTIHNVGSRTWQAKDHTTLSVWKIKSGHKRNITKLKCK